MQYDYDLAIALRIYPGRLKNKSIIHDKDKYKLVSLSLRTLKKSLSNTKFIVYAILDSCDKNYKELLYTIFNEHELIIYNDSNIGNEGTFLLQLEWLCKQKYSTNIYFAEDDYLYVPYAFSEVLSKFNYLTDKVDFLTLYDSPDYYNLPWHVAEDNILPLEYCSFIKRYSTTASFLTTQKILIENIHYFKVYRTHRTLIVVWFLLLRRFNVKPIIKSFVKSQSDRAIVFYLFAKVLRSPYLLITSIFKNKLSLYSVSPSVATHMEKDYLSQDIDWDEIINMYEKKNSIH